MKSSIIPIARVLYFYYIQFYISISDIWKNIDEFFSNLLCDFNVLKMQIK